MKGDVDLKNQCDSVFFLVFFFSETNFSCQNQLIFFCLYSYLLKFSFYPKCFSPQLLYDGGVTRQTSYIVLAVSHLLTLISTFFFLPKDFIKKSSDVPPSSLPEEADKEVQIKLTSK